MIAVSVSVKGIAELRRSIDRLPADFIKSAERAVLRAGAKPIAKAAKDKAPVGKGEHGGLLKKSIGLNVKKVGSTVTARIGPRTGFRKKIGTRVLRKDVFAKSRRRGLILAAKKGKVVDTFKDPNKYSHLVEFGSSKAPAQPFIRPAIDSASGSTLNAMAIGLERYLKRTAKRLAKKGGQR